MDLEKLNLVENELGNNLGKSNFDISGFFNNSYFVTNNLL
ncbi:hypothetical protein GFO_1956 [Christiangramia forsetii KT0803]|uniref:Uncharacterized protein n=1 Tax=Christiangramia forsetii (strain DSM 17595 / CGMCC 1.15422 / KT0803) TaxID=411154 RepID=A0M2S6_CHRFK|nr:hypothetical protein GFO_1956 [Christiangramia forsetii KT0803]